MLCRAHAHTSSTLVNEMRVGYNRVAIGVFPENPDITNATVGLPALATNPRDAGLSLITDRRLLAARPRVQQPAGEHVRTRSRSPTR